MYFYVDESGNTGARLFDLNQPTLYYGVLVASVDLIATAESRVDAMRKKLRVKRLHANELGQGRLLEIAPDLIKLRSDLSLAFDVYRVNKSDYAVIQFFDQVFDSGMNSGVTWSSYWTAQRYFILLDLAVLFDDPLRRAAWDARIEVNVKRAAEKLSEICKTLLKRIGRVPHGETRRIIRRGLKTTAENPTEISYSVNTKEQIKQITPNVVGFQFVMAGIASRTRETGVSASQIVVDRQGEFNGAQRALSEFYAKAAGIKFEEALGVMELNFDGMPQVPVTFTPGGENCGLEITDIHLWLFKLFFEGKRIALELQPLIDAQMGVGKTDVISFEGIRQRIAKTFNK